MSSVKNSTKNVTDVVNNVQMTKPPHYFLTTFFGRFYSVIKHLVKNKICMNEIDRIAMRTNNLTLDFLAEERQKFNQVIQANEIALDNDLKNYSIAQITERDLNGMVDILKKFHPAIVDNEKFHDRFNKWLTKGYLIAKEKAKEAISFDGYRFALDFFIGGFKDGHLKHNSINNLTVLWPGFLLTYRDGKYFTMLDEKQEFSDLPASDLEVVSCNGKDISSLISSNLFPYTSFDSSIESSWIRLTPWLLIDEGNPWAEKIENITYRNGDKLIKYNLNWQKIDYFKLEKPVTRSTYGETPEFLLREFGKNGIWISIPTFSNKGDKALSEIVRQLKEMRDKDPIVFDIRGNRGGDSKWVVEILLALYGKNYLGSIDIKNNHSLADDRINAELVKMKEEASYPKEYLDLLESALQRGDHFFRRKTDVHEFSELGEVKGNIINPVKGNVYLLTDGYCFSSGLIFVDSLLSIPGVTHIGATTYADTKFSMPISIKLPSGIGEVACPTMIRRQWERADNEPYVPKFKYNGFMGDTKALESWINSLANNSETPNQS